VNGSIGSSGGKKHGSDEEEDGGSGTIADQDVADHHEPGNVTSLHCPKEFHELELSTLDICPTNRKTDNSKKYTFLQGDKACVIAQFSNTGDSEIKVAKISHDILDPNGKDVSSSVKPLTFRFSRHHKRHRHMKSSAFTTDMNSGHRLVLNGGDTKQFKQCQTVNVLSQKQIEEQENGADPPQ
jgi:hypothetical protein